MKPVGQAELLEAILAVLGTPSDDADRQQVVTRHSLRESRRTLRILLAEDNKVNQLLAARLLGKRGHTVVIAANGREALAALDEPGSGGFDLVLMDVQMPDMDGFEATAIIRAREKASGTHLPIIAMTAHAMKGDEERCLAAGMDGYTSKPIEIDQLFATIEQDHVSSQTKLKYSKCIAKSGSSADRTGPPEAADAYGPHYILHCALRTFKSPPSH